MPACRQAGMVVCVNSCVSGCVCLSVLRSRYGYDGETGLVLGLGL